MSTAKLPTIVVVPGAFHVPKHFQKVTDILESNNYKVVGVTHPVPGQWQKEEASFEDLVNVIRVAIQAELEAGSDVLLVVHSASGVSGPAALKGLAKQPGDDRPGVVGIFAISALLGGAGRSVVDICAGKTCNWVRVEGSAFVPLDYDTPGDYPTKPGRVIVPPAKALYNDIPEDERRAAYDGMVPTFPATFFGSPGFAGWEDVPLTYILCEKDLAIFPNLQEEIIASLYREVKVVRVDASHSPFLSKPEEIARLIREAAGETLEST